MHSLPKLNRIDVSVFSSNRHFIRPLHSTQCRVINWIWAKCWINSFQRVSNTLCWLKKALNFWHSSFISNCLLSIRFKQRNSSHFEFCIIDLNFCRTCSNAQAAGKRQERVTNRTDEQWADYERTQVEAPTHIWYREREKRQAEEVLR